MGILIFDYKKEDFIIDNKLVTKYYVPCSEISVSKNQTLLCYLALVK